MDYHVPVLLNECIIGLKVSDFSCGTFVDATFGGGGHTFEIASKGASVIAIDRDKTAIDRGTYILNEISNKGLKVTLIHNNFTNVCSILKNLNITKVNGILMDLGVSSYQLNTPSRGFSYMSDALLDMRMDVTKGVTAYTVVNTYSVQMLVQIFKKYGEEPFAYLISKNILKAREKKEITTTSQLKEIILNSVPKKFGLTPVKRIFQAIRIEVNEELSVLKDAIVSAVDTLQKGSRICIITFHSLEDRIVKQTYNQLAKPCVCPYDFPYCVCGKEPLVKIITKKPILPSSEEVKINPRANSAKLRIAERL